MTVRTATFNGVKYDIDLCGPIDGYCDQPHGGRPTLAITADLATSVGLVSLIHEVLHASSFHSSEEVVDRTSTDLGRLLWRLGYRCPSVKA